jgi:hypothetical protein
MDDALEAAMAAYCLGSDFSFMMKDSFVDVHPIAFGGRRCRGNKIRLHSHLGKCFARNWVSINTVTCYSDSDLFG